MTGHKPPKTPCGSCPYRKDVPSGVWSRDEYEKLPQYDGDTGQQFMAGAVGVFMCHQRDGCVCGGWLVTHDVDHLAALRVNQVDPSCFDYDPGVECWPTGKAAHDHGVAMIDAPSDAALRVMRGLERLRG